MFNFQGATATLMTMPLDVMKTRVMNAEPGRYSVSDRCNTPVSDSISFMNNTFIVTFF